jgi:hypothetical protein
MSIAGCYRALIRLISEYGTIVLLGVSVALNTALARELRSVRERSDRHIALGSEAPPIAGRSTMGEPLNIRFPAGGPAIVYYFSSSCSWCERNWRNIDELAHATAGRFRLVGVSATSVPADYLETRGIRMEVVTDIQDATIRGYRLGGTPQTIVIGSNGRVVRTWIGAYQGAVAQEIEQYFHLRLPGLTPRLSMRAEGPR